MYFLIILIMSYINCERIIYINNQIVFIPTPLYPSEDSSSNSSSDTEVQIFEFDDNDAFF